MNKLDRKLMTETAERVKNWGKWGPNDELGTLNYVKPDDIVYAAGLIKTGRVFAMAIPLDSDGPQWGERGRYNPIRLMSWTGTDAIAGRQDWLKTYYADDIVTMGLQCATHWDSLGHIFYEWYENGERKMSMWNGYPVTNVDCTGCTKCGIQNTKDKLVGRGVLLDMARYLGVETMEPGQGIANEDLEKCAEFCRVEIKRGDFVLIRTGFLGSRMRTEWGKYAGGDSPGVEFETLTWIHDKEIAALALDTWGCEVRPNRSDAFAQPWHWVSVPILGLTMGENFYLDDLADACAADGMYEFFFIAPSLPFTYGAGTPTNPIAIK
jgi:kynurenine formamidase